MYAGLCLAITREPLGVYVKCGSIEHVADSERAASCDHKPILHHPQAPLRLFYSSWRPACGKNSVAIRRCVMPYRTGEAGWTPPGLALYSESAK